MFRDPLLLNLQGITFAVEFLKLKRNLKEKLSITESLAKRRVVELKSERNVWF